MKKPTPGAIDALINLLGRSRDIPQEQKAATKTYKTLEERTYCETEAYRRDGRLNRYSPGIRVSITKAGIDAIRHFGDERQRLEFQGFLDGILKRAKEELIKTEARVIELKAFISPYEVDATSIDWQALEEEYGSHG
jgi:hypothetical protein